MAARKLRPFNTAEVRQKIKAVQLINRLQKCALGEIRMSRTQLRATEILLKKILPDLTSIQLPQLPSGDSGPMVHIYIPDNRRQSVIEGTAVEEPTAIVSLPSNGRPPL